MRLSSAARARGITAIDVRFAWPMLFSGLQFLFLQLVISVLAISFLQTKFLGCTCRADADADVGDKCAA